MGNHFGPIGPHNIQSAFYGPNAVEFIATNCNVTIAHEEITCLIGEGGGRQLKWTINVAGQVSLIGMILWNFFLLCVYITNDKF